MNDRVALAFFQPGRVLLAAALLLALPLEAVLLVAGAQQAGTVLYVDSGATGGTADGSSWSDAFLTLDAALAQAVAGDAVWLAAGVYRPAEEHTPGDPRSASFRLAPGVALYGGFDPAAGADTFGERDWLAHPTVLSGDLDENDSDPEGDGIVDRWPDAQGGNAYHVVYLDGAGASPLGADTLLDGLIITAGLADGPGPESMGGGLYCGGVHGVCSPTLSNLAFRGNRATSGGGLYSDGSGGESSPLLRDVTFAGNQAAHEGGGLYSNGLSGGNASPTLINVVFHENEAGLHGGGLCSDGDGGNSSPTLVNAVFRGNRAGLYGGGLSALAHYGGTSRVTLVNAAFSGNWAGQGGGGLHTSVYGSTGEHRVINATFAGNEANLGGGIYNDNEVGSHSLSLVNVVAWGNRSAAGPAQVANSNAAPTIRHSDVQDSGGSGAWNGSLGTDGGGNLDADPLFWRAPGAGDGNWATLGDNDYGDLRLIPGSPATDAGDNATLPADDHDLDGDGDRAELLPLDLAGSPRLVDIAGSGGPPIVDQGAYETVGGPTPVTKVTYVVFVPLAYK